MGISNRIKEAIDKLHLGDPINSLIQISIAIDATGKKAYPGKKTSYRCRTFLRENQAFITKVAFGKLEIQGPVIYQMKTGRKTLEQVLYDVVRCSLLHEGVLPNGVKVTNDTVFGMTADGKVLISANLIWAMILAVIGSEVNVNESLPELYTASIGEKTIKLNDFWGKKENIYNLVKNHNK
jgi:hypothetical protein